jgi:hypothetical protein
LARIKNPPITTAMPSSGHRLTAVCMGLQPSLIAQRYYLSSEAARNG